MKISVCIPTFRRPEVLLATIREVIRERADLDLEVVVVDQTPKEEIPSSFEAELATLGEQVPVHYQWRAEANANAARNACMLQASGELVIYLDDDVLLCPGYFQAHLANYAQGLQEGAVLGVAGECYHRDLHRDLPPEALSIEQREHGTTRHFAQFSERHLGLGGNVMVGANMSVLREAAIAVGGFDENLRSYHDEGDFSKRLEQRFGERCLCYAPDAFVVHLRTPIGGHKIIKRGHSKKEMDIIMSQLLFNLRHRPDMGRIKMLYAAIRLGPLRKENVKHFTRQPQAWWGLLGAIRGALKERSNIRSPFVAETDAK